jgi:hypothetical protein
MKTKKLQLVRLTWVDSTARRAGWHDYEIDVDKEKLPEISTVGYLLHEDKKQVMVSHSVSKDDMAWDSFTIPAGCIIKRDKLGELEVEDYGATSKA